MNENFTINNVIITDQHIICYIEQNNTVYEIKFLVKLVSNEHRFIFVYDSHNAHNNHSDISYILSQLQYSYSEQFSSLEQFLTRALLQQTLPLPQNFTIGLPF